MIDADYRQLVRELCEAARLDDWEQVAYSKHLEIEGVVTGLLHDEVIAPDTFTVCFEFSERYDPMVHGRLLIHNMTAPLSLEGRGAFGLMPEQDQVAYRVDLPWKEPKTGSDLLEQIARHLRIAQDKLQECARA